MESIDNRLETTLRLGQLLPENLRARIGEFTLGQLVALRFAPERLIPGGRFPALT